MIDFSKLGKAKGQPKPTKLGELFELLDRKASHNSLRPVQIEALALLDSQLSSRDVLLKVSTGSGKTLVGLIYAEFMRRRYPDEPSIYLCPTNQLVDQVVESAAAIGVETETFDASGVPHRGLEGKSVLVCTYDRLFNALNTFARRNIRPSTIVLDDVHAGVDKVRQKYTVQVPGSEYSNLRDLFKPLCDSSDPAIWRGIVNDEVDAKFEVPYWVWIAQSATVASALQQYKEEKTICFEWTNLARYVDYARFCISGTSAELSLPVSPVEENSAYSAAKHRLFMSASIKDGSSLIRDLALDPSALSRIIEPPSDRGAGERMILPIALIDPAFPKDAIARLCAEFSRSANVVILTSSTKQSEAWVKAGATLYQGNDVDVEIQRLRGSKRGRYAVFAQRFDGVDLPDDACRVLVIDGTPTGERLCDLIDSQRQKHSPGYNSRIVNRFEQALGRAVRSSADYAAILLAGSDIASFVGRKDVKDALEAHTRAQLELGQDVAEQLRESTGDSESAIRSAMFSLTSRDNGWKEAHRMRMAKVGRSGRISDDLTLGERAAVAERQAWIEAKARNHQGAVAALQEIINSKDLHATQRAELMFRKAAYLHRVDPSQAAAVYQKAFQLNSALPRPNEIADKKYARVRRQAVNIRDYLQEFASPNAAIARLEEIRASLAYSGNAETVESGLQQLGEILGANSSRPEKETGRGPDVLWLFDSIGFCIEAKNEKESLIFKKDAEQLLMSLQWCATNTDLDPQFVAGVFATDVTAADRAEDVTFGPRLFSEKIAFDIADRIRTLLMTLSYDGPLFTDMTLIDKALRQNSLRGEDLLRPLRRL